jgi:hypothetical protein
MTNEAATATSVGDRNRHTYAIVVNGRPRTVASNEISFDEVVALADNLPSGENVVYTITYRRGHGHKPEGTLTEGHTVKVKEGMIFNVRATDKS